MYCPNPNCPDRIATGNPGEYRDDVVTCPVCGAELARGSWDDLEKRPAAPRREPPWDEGADSGEDVELLRTADAAEANAVVAALEEVRIPFWRRVEGPDGTVLGGGRSATVPGAEHVVLVPGRFDAEACAVVDELHATARALASDADDTLDWGEEADGGTPAPATSGGGFLSKLVTLVFVVLMLLGMAAVLKMVFES